MEIDRRINAVLTHVFNAIWTDHNYYLKTNLYKYHSMPYDKSLYHIISYTRPATRENETPNLLGPIVFVFFANSLWAKLIRFRLRFLN